MSDYYFSRIQVKRKNRPDDIFIGVTEFALEGQHPREILNFLIDKQVRESGVDKSAIDVTAFNKI
jgi:hypothetical protein